MNRLLFFLYTALSLALFAQFVSAGSVTLSTYYPAPTGNYNQLSATNIGIGTTAPADSLSIMNGNIGIGVNAASIFNPWTVQKGIAIKGVQATLAFIAVPPGSGVAPNSEQVSINFRDKNNTTGFSLGRDVGATGQHDFFIFDQGLFETRFGIGPSDTFLEPAGNKNVGVGEFSPNFRFELVSPVGVPTFGISSSGADANNGDRFVIDAAGNVGIGINPAPAKITIKSTDSGMFMIPIPPGSGVAPNSEQSGISFRDATNTGGFAIGRDSGATGYHDFFIYDQTGGYGGGVPRARVNIDRGNNQSLEPYGGRVGIGEFTPNFTFEVAALAGYDLFGLSSSTADVNNGDRFVVDAAGQVGIGVNPPTQKLDVNGNTKITGDATVTGNLGVTAVNATGDITTTGTMYSAGGFIWTSDGRLKKDILPLTHALDKVQNLNGVAFTWKKNGNKDIGVIAQNVEQVLPEIVKTSPQGFKGIEYGSMVALLIEAVKEQQKQIEDLKQEVSKLHRGQKSQ